MYSLGLGLSSMEVDHTADSSRKSLPEFYDSLLFAVVALLLGLDHGMGKKNQEDIVQRFLSHTIKMLERQWEEMENHFQFPLNITELKLQDYLNGPSRLDVAIFFPLAIESSYINVGMNPPEEAIKLGKMLSRVRQLNDEIVDIEEDIRAGILTFPYMHGLCCLEKRGQIKTFIEQLWRTKESSIDPQKTSSIERGAYELLLNSGSLKATAIESIRLINSCTEMVMRLFAPDRCFSLCLLITQRFAHIRRLEQNRWKEIPMEMIRQPSSMG
ncbi:MAG TPA: hypothetical protein VMW42_06910 [Desulfatiglandales bacterium]|nr:hypothetical protein [Desulfatiglandales bacterium]